MRRLYYLAGLFVPLSLGSPAAAQEADADTFEYVVVEGESCPSIAERVYGDRRRYDVVHAYNEDLGPLPHHLSPGQRLTLPVVSVRRDGPDAEVTNLRPDVQGRPGEREDWQRMHLGRDLDRGWRVNTLEEAFAELTFRDESQVALRENTVVVVLGSSAANTRRSASEARLDRGSLRARLSELRGRRLRVSTPSARAELEGGAAVVSVDESETSRVSNHAGRAVRVTTPDGQGQVRVAPGMGSRVARGERPSAPRPLPAAPAWVGSLPAQWVGVHQRTTVRGTWTAVDTARVYRVEISRSAGGAGVVAAVEVPSEITRFEVHGLPPGSYFARVSTIGRDFFESVPSAPYAFEIVLGQLHGPGQEVPQRMDPGDPSTQLRPLTLLPGSVLVAPTGMRCALVGDPAESSILTEGQQGSLRCVDAEGDAVGGLELSVQPAAVATESGAARIELVAGEPRTVRLRLRSDADLPSSLVARSSDVTVRDSAWDGEVLTVSLQADVSGTAALELVHTPDAPMALGTVEVLVSDTARESPAPRPPDEPAPPPPHTLHEGLARALLSSSVGVRDLDRRGVSASATLDYHAESTAALGDRLRTSVNMSGDLFDDHLRLSAGAAFDLYGRYD
ncbi:MAG TPA: hypothetical protein ENK57_23050, partial [Polyangiaceae bacterium]|nr:hypothetical protein [Polyangiaceae bacterium]